MKTLHYFIITLVLLSSLLLVTTIIPVQGSEGHVFFMKENSTAKIFTNFTFPVLNNKSWNISPSILGDIHDPNPIDSKYLTITVNSSSVTANKYNSTVAYTITTKNNVKGVYPLFLYYCGLSPLVVGLNESDINSAIFNEFFTAVYNCPAGSEDMPKINFIGFSNMISKNIDTNSNNSGSVDYMGPVSVPQPPFLQIDKNVYLKGDIMLLYGSIGNYTQGYNVTAKIFDNQGKTVLTQVTHPKQDSTFILRMPTNESNWKTGGPYDLKVWYGSCCYIGDHTFTFYEDQLPPLKQEEAEMAFWNIKCNSGLVMMMKQEDGSIACVRPDSLQKLISLKWSYDPSEKLTTYGLKDIYHVGQEIDFKFRINGFGNRCEQPTVTVRNSDQKIMWQSSQYVTGCANGLKGNVKNEAYLGRESHLGYDYNQYGPLMINQTGTYSMNISWLDGNITKEFSIIP